MRMHSLTGKLFLAIVPVFLLASGIGLYLSYRSSDETLLRFAGNEAGAIADAYFDSLNKMMLTGGMAERSKLAEEMRVLPNVLDARVVRGEAVNTQYGPGLPGETASDDLERLAFKGQATTRVDKTGNGRVLTVIRPFMASERTRDVNCLQCHAVPAGTVLGAVRIELSLAGHDRALRHGLLTQALAALALLALGLTFIAWMLRTLLKTPLHQLSTAMQQIERDSDLGLRIATDRNDELGDLSRYFDSMLDKFGLIVGQVRAAVENLGHTSRNLNVVSELTRIGVERQLTDTASLSTAMTEMREHIRVVEEHSRHTAEAARTANEEAQKSVLQSNAVMEANRAMVEELGRAAGVVQQLNDEGHHIGAVVGLIHEIADQTNLLSLNAAIEAARAGEAGRGFAVVADEVRKLAQRTQEATEEIHAIVERIQNGSGQAVQAIQVVSDKTAKGVALVETNVLSLNDIASAIALITHMSAQIDAATQAQGASAEKVGQNVMNIDQATHQTTSVARQTHDASENLTALTYAMKALVEQFRISAEASALSAPAAEPEQTENAGGDVTLF